MDPDAVDAGRFDRLRQDARRHVAARSYAEAADLLEQALGLWRGPALADLRDAPFAESEVVHLEEDRLLAEEDAFDLELELSRHQQIVSDLEERVRTHPTRERFWGQLMVALYRSDRQADALTAYGRARGRLADELGIDPGEALRQLEVAVLRQDPSLTAPTPLPGR